MLIMYIDCDTALPFKVHLDQLDKNGVVIESGSALVKYPDHAPANIYELGVPRDTKVIDKTTAR